MMSRNCVYCEINPQGKSDHVFPKSLGGEDIYMDCVCDKCNNDFSKAERELFQKSFIGLLRSSERVEGYSKNKRRPAPLKFPEIFQFDKEHKIVYEVGVHDGFKPYLRPQFIQADNGIYAEGSSQDELESLVKHFNEWRQKNLIMVTKFPPKKGDCYEAIRFFVKDNVYVAEKIELSKVKKEVIHYCLMKDNDEFTKYFEPRMFCDDSDKLLVRSRTVEEGVQFAINLLNYCNQEAATFSNYTTKSTNDPIKISMKFNMVMMQQALVKIGLNALMHYHPETKYDPLLKPIKSFVAKGTAIRAAIDEKINVLDTRQDMHSVLFFQSEDGLRVRTSLFGGLFTYSFLVEGLKLFQKGHFSGLEVDYKKAKQEHYKMDEYLLNRASDMGFLNSKINE